MKYICNSCAPSCRFDDGGKVPLGELEPKLFCPFGQDQVDFVPDAEVSNLTSKPEELVTTGEG
jgi:hypothetical protein